MGIENPQGIAPLPSERDRQQVDELAKSGLGEHVVGRFIGAMAKGQHGDAAFYGHAVIIEDPQLANHSDSWKEYIEQVGATAQSIGNNSPVAGNVIIDITDMSESSKK